MWWLWMTHSQEREKKIFESKVVSSQLNDMTSRKWMSLFCQNPIDNQNPFQKEDVCVCVCVCGPAKY